MRHQILPVIGLLVACGLGCTKAKEETQAAVATAIVDKALSDKGQHVDSSKMMAAMADMQNAQKQPKREVINFRKLTPFLPEPPAGWTAQPVEGSTTAMGTFKVSDVSRRYTKGPSNLKLTISDMSQNPGLAMIPVAFAITEDSTTGFRKPYAVGGVNGSEHWTIASKQSQIDALTKNQLLINLEGGGLEGPEVARDFMAKVDVAKVADLTP